MARPILDIRPTTIGQLQDHEAVVRSNVRLGQFSLGELCPIEEVQCFRATLENSDLRRLFVICDLANATVNNSGLLADVIPDKGLERAMEYMDENAVNDFDLTGTSDLEPIFITSCLQSGALTAIDGNHRILAHFLAKRSIDSVRVFVAQHQNVDSWEYLSPSAKEFAG